MKFLAEHLSMSETWEVDITTWIYANGTIKTDDVLSADFTILLKNKFATYTEFGSVQITYDRVNCVYKIYNVYVAPQYRNKGYCTIMISMAVDFAEKYCIDGVCTIVANAGNEIEKRVFEKNCFKAEHYDKNKKCWRMTRRLC